MTQLPRRLTFQDRTVNYMGRGRVAGSHAYMDFSKGRTLELFRGTVVQSGHLYALVQVEQTRSMAAVRIDHARLVGGGPPQEGDELLVGPIQYLPDGPFAEAGWSLSRKTKAAPQPARSTQPWPARRPSQQIPPASIAKQKRLLGVISQIHATGTFGRILTDDGHYIFVHSNDCNAGVFRPNQRVSFHVAQDPRGPKAVYVASA